MGLSVETHVAACLPRAFPMWTERRCKQRLYDKLLFGRYFYPGFSAMERVESSIYIDRGIAAGETLLGAFFRFARAVHVDLAGALGALGKNRHFVRQYFREPPRHSQMLLGRVFAIGYLADRKLGDQRSMAGENAKIPVLAGNLDLFSLRLHHLLFRCDDLELENVCHSELSAFSRQLSAS